MNVVSAFSLPSSLTSTLSFFAEFCVRDSNWYVYCRLLYPISESKSERQSRVISAFSVWAGQVHMFMFNYDKDPATFRTVEIGRKKKQKQMIELEMSGKLLDNTSTICHHVLEYFFFFHCNFSPLLATASVIRCCCCSYKLFNHIQSNGIRRIGVNIIRQQTQTQDQLFRVNCVQSQDRTRDSHHSLQYRHTHKQSFSWTRRARTRHPSSHTIRSHNKQQQQQHE